MKLAIMQPYFLPYIGYWQLINAVDVFVIYDNIQYTKKGWINRNRFLQNGTDALFTLPLKKGSDFLDVRERGFSDAFDRRKMLRQFSTAYSKAPYYDEAMPLITGIVEYGNTNLFGYILNSVNALCRHLDIKAEIVISSNVSIDHGLKAENKVMAICKSLQAETYINAIGGQSLYSKDWFAAQDVDLKFIKSGSIEYRQFGGEFVPWLSILDVLMFNSIDSVKEMLDDYILV
jgi:hypothetical protein